MFVETLLAVTAFILVCLDWTYNRRCANTDTNTSSDMYEDLYMVMCDLKKETETMKDNCHLFLTKIRTEHELKHEMPTWVPLINGWIHRLIVFEIRAKIIILDCCNKVTEFEIVKSKVRSYEYDLKLLFDEIVRSLNKKVQENREQDEINVFRFRTLSEDSDISDDDECGILSIGAEIRERYVVKKR